MKAIEIADRYTRSVFEMAEETSAIQNLFQELAAVRTAMTNRPELLHMLQNPLITRDEKRSLIEGILGPKSTVLARHFLNLLVEKNRIELFPFIVDRLQNLIHEKQGIQEASVIAARELHPSILQLIQKALETTLRKKILIQTETDPYLLGGLQIRIGNRMIDGTLRAKLDALDSRLRGARV